MVRFIVFGGIWEHFVTTVNSVQNWPNWCNSCKSSCHKVASDVFTTNAPNRPHRTTDSSFVAFHSVWGHLGEFRYHIKLGAKWAELVQLMQNFKPRSRVGSFRNERTQSNPLEPKLVFCCISYCFVTVVNSLQNELNWCN